MADKSARHHVIREIVTARAVASQEELRKQLLRRGWDVTQSTLSRDLRELRLARIPDEQGRVRPRTAPRLPKSRRTSWKRCCRSC